MSRHASPQFFRTPDYSGFWLPYEGDRLALRARIESVLRRELADPGGFLQVRADGPHWIGTQVSLSYSHSEKQALVVYSRAGAIGVDIERADRKLTQSPEELARRFFHASEVAAIRSGRDFLELWCKKEAIAKQTRAGLREWLARPLQECSTTTRIQPVPNSPEGWIAYCAIAQ